jgi:hypothetical protein
MSFYTFQGARIVAPVSFETDELLFVNNTLTMRQERLTFSGQRWRITFNVQPQGNANILVHMLNRLIDSFDFTVPQPDDPKLFAPLSSTTSATASKGATGFQTAATLPAGRFVKFANHSKVYMVTSQTGQSTTLYPALEAELPSGTAFNYGNNVVMRVYYDDSQTRGITFENGLLSNPGTVTLVEHV